LSEQKNWVVDANIILRHLLYDLPEQAEKVEKVLGQAENGEVRLLIPEPVLSDVVFVLTYLKVSKLEIAASLRGWINLPGVDLLGIDTATFEMALDLFVDQNIKWSDALIASHMLTYGYTRIFTFDKHFNRIPGITKIDL